MVRRSEFYIAVLTAIFVFAVGVEQGIILAVVLSLIEMVRRQYHPHRFVVGVSPEGRPTFTQAKPGIESAPGLLVFRYDADLFYANANQFSDDVQQLMTAAPSRIRWLVLDCSSIPDVDYSAGAALYQLVTYVHSRNATFALAALDPSLRAALDRVGVLERLTITHVYDTVEEAVAAYAAESHTDPIHPEEERS
jgi:sulfate permease, SulP family